MSRLGENIKKIKRKINDGYLDFSNMKVKDYTNVISTYEGKTVTALINEEDKKIINDLIISYQKNRTQQFFWDRKTNITFENSWFLRIYCNGFHEGYKQIEKKIKKNTLPPEAITRYVDQYYIKELENRNNYPKNYSKRKYFFDFLWDLGKEKGATVKLLLYDSPMQKTLQKRKSGQKPTFEEMIVTLDDEDKQKLFAKIEEYLSTGAIGKRVALMIHSLWQLGYLLEIENIRHLTKAIREKFQADIGSYEGIKKYLDKNTPNNFKYEIENLINYFRIK